MVENRLDQLKFARQRTAPFYVAAVLAVPTPEQSDARISWAKNGLLTLIIDDFFDVGGSVDELTNLTQCVEKWNINVDTDCCSDEVRFLFLAIQAEVCWTRDKAFNLQAREQVMLLKVQDKCNRLLYLNQIKIMPIWFDLLICFDSGWIWRRLC